MAEVDFQVKGFSYPILSYPLGAGAGGDGRGRDDADNGNGLIQKLCSGVEPPPSLHSMSMLGDPLREKSSSVSFRV